MLNKMILNGLFPKASSDCLTRKIKGDIESELLTLMMKVIYFYVLPCYLKYLCKQFSKG